MKKIAATLFLVYSCLIAIAQNSNTLTFLGIPVDGSEQAMKNKLKQKGFKEKYGYDCLTGQFNGETVDVYIHTNHQIVDRIYVAFRPTTEHEICIMFNRLLTQFQNNNKYSGFYGNTEISMNEDISNEILVNHKRYEASFRYINPDLDVSEEEFMERFLTALSSTLSEEQVTKIRTQLTTFFNSSGEERESMLSIITSELTNNSKIIEENADFLNEHPELLQKYYESILAVMKASQSVLDSFSTGHVWFMIHENFGKFNIGLYYDNLANRPNGEDL